MAIKARRKVINTQMNKEIKVIKLGTHRTLRWIISGKVKDKCYDAIDAASDNTAEALFLVHTDIMGNVWHSIFELKINDDLLKRLK